MTKEQFKIWRNYMGFTQSEAGKTFEVTRNTIQNYEAGYSPISKAVELACEYLKVKKDLLDG